MPPRQSGIMFVCHFRILLDKYHWKSVITYSMTGTPLYKALKNLKLRSKYFFHIELLCCMFMFMFMCKTIMRKVIPGVWHTYTQIHLTRIPPLCGFVRMPSTSCYDHNKNVKMPLSELNLCFLYGRFVWLPLSFDLYGEYACEPLRGIFEDVLLCRVSYDN